MNKLLAIFFSAFSLAAYADPLMPLNSVTLSYSITSSALTPVALPAGYQNIRIVNEGSSAVFIALSSTATSATLPNTTASQSSTPISAKEDATFTALPSTGTLYFSAITRSNTVTIDVQLGTGQ